MRASKTFVLLAAALPIVLSSIIPPPDGQCHEGDYTCIGNNIERCGSDGRYKVIQECTEDERCIYSDLLNPPVVCFPEYPESFSLPIATNTSASVPVSKTSGPAPSSPPTSSPSAPVYNPSKETCPTIGQSRCVINHGWVIEECSPVHHWFYVKTCAWMEICSDYNNQARCDPVKAAAVPAPEADPNSDVPTKRPDSSEHGEQCTNEGGYRCVDNTMYRCVSQSWKRGVTCPKSTKCTETNGAPMCKGPDTAPPAPEPCTPGDRTCDGTYYSLLLCGVDKKWTTEMKCNALRDCKIDGPGQAHCESGGMRPPKMRRTVD